MYYINTLKNIVLSPRKHGFRGEKKFQARFLMVWGVRERKKERKREKEKRKKERRKKERERERE